MSLTLVPYLIFKGKTKQAMEFYHGILGGELKLVSFAESGMPTTEETKDYMMHASLENGALSIMASDGRPEDLVSEGDNVQLSLIGDDEAKLTEYFNKLGEGGKVDMPLSKQSWGDTYGQITDKFGIHWMVNITSVS